MRFECADYPGNWVEYSPVWTRREVRQSFAVSDAALIEFAASKTTALHLERIGGAPLTDPAELNDDGLADVQWEVFAWWRYTIIAAAAELGRLGEASGRRLLQRQGESAATTNNSPTPG